MYRDVRSLVLYKGIGLFGSDVSSRSRGATFGMLLDPV